MCGGVQSQVVQPVRSGIKQGAIGYDPIARSVLSAVPRQLECLGVFADDLGLAMLDVYTAMMAIGPVFADMARAANLRMQGSKTRLLYFGDSSVLAVRRTLARCARLAEVQVAEQEKHLGVMIGIGSAASRWTYPLAKFQARVRHVSSMPLHLHQRLQAYGMYVLSVMWLTVQNAPVTSELRMAEQAAHARMLRAPMHALGPGLLPFLSELGGQSMLADLPLTADGAAIR